MSDDVDPTTKRERAAERSEAVTDWLERRVDGTAGAAAEYSKMVLVGLFIAVTWPFVFVLKHLPKTSSIGDKLIRTGFVVKHKLSKADVIGLPIYGDGLVQPKAMYWNSEHEEYEASGGEAYSAAGEGHRPYRMFGRVPVVFTLRAAAEVFEPVQAYAAGQREEGKWLEVEKADGKTDVLIDSHPGYRKDPSVATDGGTSSVGAGLGKHLHGAAASASDQLGKAYHGKVISWEKAFEMHYQKINQSDLKKQWDLGRLSELDPGEKMKLLFIMLGLYVGGIATAVAMLWVLKQIGTGATVSFALSNLPAVTGWLV